MPLFRFHDCQGPPMVISTGKRAGMQGSMVTRSPEIYCLHASCTMGERRFLHSVETLHRVSKSAEVGL